MSLINLIIIIAIVGFLLWLVNKFVPMEPPIKQIMIGVVVILLVLWILSLFFPGLGGIRVGR